MTSAWQLKRTEPYTLRGLLKKKCIRCDRPAYFQWQICSDGNNFRPLCEECDIALNKLVLKWMRHPHYAQLAQQYADEKRQLVFDFNSQRSK